MEKVETYWGKPKEEAKKEALVEKAALLNVNGQRAVLDAKASVSTAKAFRNKVIVGASNSDEPDFKGIVSANRRLADAEALLAATEAVQKALFG